MWSNLTPVALSAHGNAAARVSVCRDTQSSFQQLRDTHHCLTFAGILICRGAAAWMNAAHVLAVPEHTR